MVYGICNQYGKKATVICVINKIVKTLKRKGFVVYSTLNYPFEWE